MSLRTAAEAQRAGFAVLGASVLSGVILSVAALVILTFRIGFAPPRAGDSASPRIAYLEYGSTADALWLVDPAQPQKRRKVDSFDHGAEFGILPSRSPDGSAFAYTALPAGTVAPNPDTPAELWLVGFNGKDPKRLARDLDLLVRPVWANDGSALIFRRSRPQYGLFLLDLRSGRERPLASAPDAMFPIAFSAADGLLFVRLQANGSDLYRLHPADQRERLVAHLADGLTRDWALSPDGKQLAYLSLSFADGGVASRAFVFDITSARLRPVGDGADSEFSPVWHPDGSLSVGSLAAGAGSVTVLAADGSVRPLPGPARGFDVPVAWSAANDLLVRTFEGSSAVAPGRATVTLIDSEGRRRRVTDADVSVLGWVTP